MVVFQGVRKEDLQKLKGFKGERQKTVHEELRLTKGEVSFVLYSSGKLLLQGKPAAIEKAVEVLSEQEGLLELTVKIEETGYRAVAKGMEGTTLDIQYFREGISLIHRYAATQLTMPATSLHGRGRLPGKTARATPERIQFTFLQFGKL